MEMEKDCFIEDYGEGGPLRKALEAGTWEAEVVLGPLNETRRKIIREMLEKYPRSFTCHVLKESPRSHMQIIGDNVCFEEPHSQEELYNYAYIVEKMSAEGKDLIMANFALQKSKAVKVTLENVDTI